MADKMGTRTSSLRLTPAVLRRILVASLTGGFLLALLAPGCTLDVGDQACTPSSDVLDKEDRCPYGSPGGPRLPVESCQAVNPKPVDQCTAAPTWADVFALFSDTARGNCTDCNCHGNPSTSAAGLTILPEDPEKAYTAVTTFQTTQRGFYVKPGQTGASWIVCNIRGDTNGGKPMPPATSGLPDDLAAINTVLGWAECGAKQDGTPVAGVSCTPPPEQKAQRP
jgi:hypothetical protein